MGLRNSADGQGSKVVNAIGMTAHAMLTLDDPRWWKLRLPVALCGTAYHCICMDIAVHE